MIAQAKRENKAINRFSKKAKGIKRNRGLSFRYKQRSPAKAPAL